MHTIWKFPIPIQDSFTIIMPQGARVLSVETQGDVPFIWVMVDEEADQVEYHFELRGTGHNCDKVVGYKHIGTFLMRQESLVLHLFAMNTTPEDFIRHLNEPL